MLVAGGSFALTGAVLRAARPTPAGVITLQVKNPDGEPARCNATLWAVREDGGRVLTADASTRCDEDGVLRWEGRTPGNWRVIAYVENCEALDLPVELGVEHGVDAGVHQPGWGGLLVGTVTEDGQPVQGAEVRSATGQHFVTGADGAFKLQGMPIGEVEVRAARGFSGGVAKTVVTRGGRSSVEIELQPVAPRGVIGIGVERVGEVVRIKSVTPGGPAEGHIQPGDELIAIEDQAIEGDLDRTRRLLAGEPGAAVRLRIGRGGQTLDEVLTRASVQDL